MSETVSWLRQQLWQAYRALARTLRLLQRDAPMVQGSLYLLLPQMRQTQLPLRPRPAPRHLGPDPQ